MFFIVSSTGLNAHEGIHIIINMGHEHSQFAPLDPDLEDENLLLVLLPVLLERAGRKPPVAQSTSVLTGKKYVEEVMDGNDATFLTVTRMDKGTFKKLIILLRSAGFADSPH